MSKIYYKAMDRVEGQPVAGKCLDQIYVEGETYEIDEPVEVCSKGFHFCTDLVLTLRYYPLDGTPITKNIYAEVEALGETVFEGPTNHKGCTSKIKIVRFLSDEEVLALVDENNNSGDDNSGRYNSGHYNSGDDNSGNRNSGHYNSGDCNSGNRNSGDCNSGNWNSCSRESGYFNSVASETIRVFNKELLRADWDSCVKPELIYFDLECGKTYKECFQDAYNKAPIEDKRLLINLPNFDAEVFYEISGIDVTKDDDIKEGLKNV